MKAFLLIVSLVIHQRYVKISVHNMLVNVGSIVTLHEELAHLANSPLGICSVYSSVHTHPVHTRRERERRTHISHLLI